MGKADIPPKPSITFDWEYVTPEIAACYLSLNFERNRNLRTAWRRYLAHVLRRGEFLVTHQGIAFDEGGFLIDGQHRLEAIRESGVAAWIAVARGVDRASVLAMDRHAKRAEHEQLKITDPDILASKTAVAIARIMYSRGGYSRDYRLDGVQLAEFMRTHAEAISFSTRHSSRKGTSSASVRGAIASAFYFASHDRLEEFARVLDTGEASGPADFAAIRLRDRLEKEQALVLGGADARASCFRLTCSAIKAFLERQPIKRLSEPKEDLFMIPDVRVKLTGGWSKRLAPNDYPKAS